MIGYITNWYLTRGKSEAAWDRCLPIWHQNGGIDDWRGVIGRPFYSPSRGVRLAKVFAKRHSSASDVKLLLQYTQDADPVTALCAIDLLVVTGVQAPQTIPQLIASTLPLDEKTRQTLTLDAAIDAQSMGDPAPQFDTVGSYLRWQLDEFGIYGNDQ